MSCFLCKAIEKGKFPFVHHPTQGYFLDCDPPAWEEIPESRIEEEESMIQIYFCPKCGSSLTQQTPLRNALK